MIDDAMNDAAKLFELLKLNNVADIFIDQLVSSATQEISNRFASLDIVERNRLEFIYVELLNEYKSELLNQLETAYRTSLGDQVIANALAFSESDEGRAYTNRSQEFESKLPEIVGTWAMPILSKLEVQAKSTN